MKRLDLIGCGLLLLCVLIGISGYTQMRSNTEDVLEWLPDQSQEREDLRRFEDWFGSDDYLVITWENCTVNDPRIEELRLAILSADHEGFIQNVLSGQQLMRTLTERYRMSSAEVARRLKGVFFGRERPSLTCLNVELSNLGGANRKKSMDLVHLAISQVPGLASEKIVFGGYPFIATTIDRLLLNSLRFLFIPSVIIATCISYVCLRDFRLMAIVFITSISAASVSLMIIPLVGVQFGGLMSIIPALVFVLATSGCIHLVRYSLTTGTNPRDLLAVGWLPCSVSAVTTIVGMLALMGSQFPAIRKFGLFCAVGVAVAWVFQLVLVPWLLQRAGKAGIERLTNQHSHSRFWQNWHRVLLRYKLPLSIIGLVLLIVPLFGLRHLQAQVQVQNLFRTDSPVLESLRKLEDQLGPLNQSELVLVFKNVDQEQFDERVRQIRELQTKLAAIEEVHIVHSLMNYLPNEPRVTDGRSLAQRSMYRSRLRNERENLGNRRNLIVDAEQEIWRISLRFPFTVDNDWDTLRRRVENVSNDWVQKLREQNSNLQVEWLYTGRAHLFHHAQMHLLEDLFRNFLGAFAVITPILIVVLRSLVLGLLAMLPNLFPAVLLFGGLGFVNYPVDLAIAMTACIALGIAVDDTTHFLVRYRDLGGRLLLSAGPVERALGQCGPAMTHSTLIACGGLLIYAFGEMLVVARFSVMISLLLFFALLADLIMMPSILLTIESLFGSKKSLDRQSAH